MCLETVDIGEVSRHIGRYGITVYPALVLHRIELLRLGMSGPLVRTLLTDGVIVLVGVGLIVMQIQHIYTVKSEL